MALISFMLLYTLETHQPSIVMDLIWYHLDSYLYNPQVNLKGKISFLDFPIR